MRYTLDRLIEVLYESNCPQAVVTEIQRRLESHAAVLAALEASAISGTKQNSTAVMPNCRPAPLSADTVLHRRRSIHDVIRGALAAAKGAVYHV